MTEAEIGGMQSQAKNTEDCWQPLEGERGKEGFSPRAFRGSVALRTPDVSLLTSSTMR